MWVEGAVGWEVGICHAVVGDDHVQRTPPGTTKVVRMRAVQIELGHTVGFWGAAQGSVTQQRRRGSQAVLDFCSCCQCSSGVQSALNRGKGLQAHMPCFPQDRPALLMDGCMPGCWGRRASSTTWRPSYRSMGTRQNEQRCYCVLEGRLQPRVIF